MNRVFSFQIFFTAFYFDQINNTLKHKTIAVFSSFRKLNKPKLYLK